MITVAWAPAEWQALALSLLVLHYDVPNWTRVPDKVHGDGGMEGFSNTGHAYQCYAPQDCISEKQRTEKIRDKINEDLNKFVDNRTFLETILNSTKITHWFLMTPNNNDKSLISYCEFRKIKVLKAGLPYVDPAFCIKIVTHNEFPLEFQKIMTDSKLLPIQINENVPIDDQAILHWKESNDGPVSAISSKVDLLTSLTANEKDALKELLMKWQIMGENLMSQLLVNFSDQHAKMTLLRSQLESQVEAGSILTNNLPQPHLQSMMDLCRAEIVARIPGLPPEVITSLVQATIAYWVVRCPLRWRQRP